MLINSSICKCWRTTKPSFFLISQFYLAGCKHNYWFFFIYTSILIKHINYAFYLLGPYANGSPFLLLLICQPQTCTLLEACRKFWWLWLFPPLTHEGLWWMLSNKCRTTQSPVIPLGLVLLVMLEERGCQKRLALTGCRHTSANASRLRMWLRKCNEGKGDDAISSGSLWESKNEAYVLEEITGRTF